MMRLWLSRNAAESLREQLVIQIRLGILSGDLAPGDRLPSVRELGRRHNLHANTVSAAYRELQGQGLLGFRKGSGVYVNPVRAPLAVSDAASPLDEMVAELLQQARERGFSAERVREVLQRHVQSTHVKCVIVLEPEPELGQILAEELRSKLPLPVTNHVLSPTLPPMIAQDAAAVAILSRAHLAREVLPPNSPCYFLRLRSMAEHLANAQRPTANALIGVASCSPEILRRARTLLSAVGMDADALEFRDAREPNWSRGLSACAFVIADVLTAKRLPKACQTRVLRVLADSSVDELRSAWPTPPAGRQSGTTLPGQPQT